MVVNPRFEFQKCRQLFFGAHNEALSVVAMCVSNPDGSACGIPWLIRSPNAIPLC